MAVAQSRFPSAAGIDLIEHVLRVNVNRLVKGRRQRLETLVFNGRMTIERGRPSVNPNGRRQIDFLVRSWVATAFSKVLNQEVTYILSPDVKQQPSTILAQQEGRDYPATFLFNVIFDARVGNRVMVRRHHGRPIGLNFRRVPPGGDRRTSPTITRFEPTRIQVQHPQIGRLEFVPVDCNDGSGRTVARIAG